MSIFVSHPLCPDQLSHISFPIVCPPSTHSSPGFGFQVPSKKIGPGTDVAIPTTALFPHLATYFSSLHAYIDTLVLTPRLGSDHSPAPEVTSASET
jgi:hypothetical protein